MNDSVDDVLKKVSRRKAHEPSDDELACEFAARYSEDWRYCHALRSWFVWDGARWRPETTLLALEVVSQLCAEYAADFKEQKLASGKTINAVLQLARAKRELATEAAQWDSNPDILCTPGGVVDLRTGKLRPALRTDYCTRQIRATPVGTCPLWTAKVAEILPDAAERAFFQRFAGMAATGHVLEHAFLYCEGSGRNGKSLLFNLLLWLLSDYAAAIAVEVLLASKFDRHPTELAQLRGRRLITATEVPHGRAWNESRIKWLTGGDPISARKIGGDFFTFDPTHTLVVFGNEPLKLRGINPAWEERMLFLRFLQSFIGDKADKELPIKLRKEAPGIAAWVIQGAVLWYKHGLAAPESVHAATRDYMTEQDVIGRWIADGWQTDAKDPKAATEIGVLYTDYKEWCGKVGEYAETENALSRALDKRFPRSKQQHPETRRVVYRGFIRLQKSNADGKASKPSDPPGNPKSPKGSKGSAR
jgi:putative DNA primase/helicase